MFPDLSLYLVFGGGVGQCRVCGVAQARYRTRDRKLYCEQCALDDGLLITFQDLADRTGLSFSELQAKFEGRAPYVLTDGWESYVYAEEGEKALKDE